MTQYRPAVGSTPRARRLRHNMTAAERAMWRILRSAFADVRFRRQVPIGPSVTDFASHGARLVIEVDGGQHCDERDAGRTKRLAAAGYRVLRFWNNDVLANGDGVASSVEAALGS